MHPVRTLPALACAALLAAPAAAQDLSAIDYSGAWKSTGKVTFEPNPFGLKKAKLALAMHVVHEGTVLSGIALDKVPGCGTYTPPLDGSSVDGAFLLHLLAPGHAPKTCEEQGHLELMLAGVPLDNVRASFTGTGEMDLGWLVFPFTLEGKAKRVSGMLAPDDPDGPGPGVPVAQVGQGEPGSGGAHDLAIVLLKAPKLVKTKGVPAAGRGVVRVQLRNRSQHVEVVEDAAMLAQLVTLELQPDGPPLFDAGAVLRAPPAGKFPLLLKPRAKLAVSFDVDFTALPEAAAAPCATQAFAVTAAVHHEALAGAQPDDHPADDVAPRGVLPPFAFDTYPDGKQKDRGAGGKQPDGTLGAPVTLQAGACPGGT